MPVLGRSMTTFPPLALGCLDISPRKSSLRCDAGPFMRLRPESPAFLLFISALGGIPPLSIDMGLPALEAIGHSLDIPPASAALTLSFFLAGFAFGPIALGPLSDRFGRRP